MKAIIRKIKKAKKIVLFGHKNPDPDCLGSLSALKQALNYLHKEADIVISEQIKSKYSYLKIKKVTEYNLPDYDLIICIDTASPAMLSDVNLADVDPNKLVVIDHHHSRFAISENDYVDETCSSCAEIIFNLIKKLHVKINPQIATCLYTGLAGDTGCFLHDNTTESTHVAASQLMSLGADVSMVNRVLFKSRTRQNLKIVKMAIEKMNFIKDGLIVCFSNEELKSLDVNPNDSIEIIDFISSIDEVNITALVTEKNPNEISVSLRSSKKYDVSKLAKNFGGGGHRQASGFKILNGNLQEFIKQFTVTFKEYIKENTNG